VQGFCPRRTITRHRATTKVERSHAILRHQPPPVKQDEPRHGPDPRGHMGRPPLRRPGRVQIAIEEVSKRFGGVVVANVVTSGNCRLGLGSPIRPCAFLPNREGEGERGSLAYLALDPNPPPMQLTNTPSKIAVASRSGSGVMRPNPSGTPTRYSGSQPPRRTVAGPPHNSQGRMAHGGVIRPGGHEEAEVASVDPAEILGKSRLTPLGRSCCDGSRFVRPRRARSSPHRRQWRPADSCRHEEEPWGSGGNARAGPARSLC
jgi:hypothetical protein